MNGSNNLADVARETIAAFTKDGQTSQESEVPQEIVGMYEVFDALQEAIEASTPEARIQLSSTIDKYARDFPDDYFWAIGPQSPFLLKMILASIEAGAASELCQKCETEAARRARTKGVQA